MVTANQTVVVAPPDSKAIATRAAKGAVALGGRQFFVHGLNVAGSIILARLCRGQAPRTHEVSGR